MIAKPEYCSRELIFKNVFRTSQTKSSTRIVFYIRLTTSEGEHFYGECAPLPQFGSEDFPEVEDELKRLTGIENFELPGSEDGMKTFLDELTNLPTVKCAVEQALFQMQASKNILPAEFINDKQINVNALVDLLSKNEIIESIARLCNEGFTTIKLKAGREKFEDDLDIISGLHEKFRNEFKLRLDVNGKWNIDEAFRNLKQLENYNIEYVEQPVKNTAELIELSRNIKLPLAADESIRNVEDANKLLESSAIKYFVIKPMLIGGYYKTKEIVETAKAKNVKVIISSSLESNVGRRHLIAIASAMGGNTAHGLGTSDLFVNDPVSDTFPVEKGKINYSPGLIKVENIPFG